MLEFLVGVVLGSLATVIAPKVKSEAESLFEKISQFPADVKQDLESEVSSVAVATEVSPAEAAQAPTSPVPPSSPEAPTSPTA